MEFFLESISSYFSKSENILTLSETVRSIILNENHNIKLEQFKNLINYGKQISKSDDDSDLDFHTCVLFLYLLDIHRDFKNDLLSFLKEKSLKTKYEKVVRLFFRFIKAEPSLRNINHSRVKVKLFNNLFEACRLIFSDSILNEDCELIKFQHENFKDILLTDLDFHLKNINEEVTQFLIMFFKYFYCFYKAQGSNNDLIKNDLSSLLENNLACLISHINSADLVYYNKDLEFNFATSIFLLFTLIYENKEDYLQQSFSLLKHFEFLPHHLLTCLKSFFINCPNLDETNLQQTRIPFLNNLIKKYFIIPEGNLNKNTNDDTKFSDLSLINFYKLFLENDLKYNFTALINDLIMTSLHRLDKLSSLEDFILNEGLLSKLLAKMSRDKNNFNIMDDNYYYILEYCHKVSPKLAKEVERLSNAYLNELINKKERLMMIEARMFKFIDINKGGEENVTTMKSFFSFIFSRPYEKKNLSLINEYIKILFDFFFSSGEIKDSQSQLNNYKKFIQIFPEPFFNYLMKIQLKDLKFLNNILINLEKFNKNFYALIVNEFYKKYFEEQNLPTDYIQKFSILLTLLKPFKSHKKSLMAKDDKIIFDLVVIENSLEIKISLDLKILETIAKLSDRFLVLYLIEFITGLDGQDKLFSIIKTLLKYNVKSSYIEYKSSIMKALVVYFSGYIDKIAKTLVKAKPKEEDLQFIEEAERNFEFLFKFLSDNIYDRPVENLLVYLEILIMNINLFDKNLSPIQNKIKNSAMKNSVASILAKYESAIFNKNLAFSLVSLLRQSWFFVRYTVFLILKNEKYFSVLDNIKNILTLQIKESLFSLRQMDVEGSVNLFLLLTHHFKSEFCSQFFSNVLKMEIEKEETSHVKNTLINSFQSLVRARETDYFTFLSEKANDNRVYDCSLHSFFVMIRNILEEEKEGNNLDSDLVLELGMSIIVINTKFSEYLVNNGVSEFSTDLEEGGVDNSEDKGLISLWCSAKYSIEALNLVLDTLSNNFKILAKRKDFSNVLAMLKDYQAKIINLMIDYKHMGAVLTLNDSLLKVSILLNKVDESHKEFRDETYNWVRDFLETKLVKEEVSSILRRSAGIPFILTTLIKSYLPQDKLSNFSHNKVIDILKSSIDTLLSHYKTYITLRPDVSVHCLHILRVISDDTSLKPFAKEFYDFIILKIVDGLGNENWSVKNACMLLFSKLIKNNFTLNDIRQRNIPTFVEYFTGKEELKNKIFEILTLEVNKVDPLCNDSLILLVTFFSKFKPSKPVEINEQDLTNMINVLFSLAFKNNKLFKKLLTTSIIKLYGDNINLGYTKILKVFEENKNNDYDLFFNLVKNLNEKKHTQFISEVMQLCIEKLYSTNGNFFLLNKIIKFFSKIKKDDIILNIIIEKNLLAIDENKNINFEEVSKLLAKFSKRPFYFKFIKNTLDLYLRSGKYTINNFTFDMIKPSNEEILNFVMKKYPNEFFSQFEAKAFISDLLTNDQLSKMNVNISTKVIDYLIKNNKFYNDKETTEKLLINLFKLASNNNSVTKLIKKILKFIIKLYTFLNENKFGLNILNLVENFGSSHNEEKMRFVSVQTFESYLFNSDALSKKLIPNLEVILKIFVLILNDDHPEIRNYSSQIFTEFLTKTNIINFKNQNKNVYSNDYLMKKLLSLVLYNQQENSEAISMFFNYLINENIYFEEEKSKMNSDDKVFYYEPENRYVDNIEIKIKIMNLLCHKEESIVKNNLNGKTLLISEKIESPVKVLLMLESFVNFFTTNFNMLKNVLLTKTDFPFIELRNRLYNY